MNDNTSMTSSISAKSLGLTAEQISRRAYELWEQEGRPEGRDLHHWLRAEQELAAETAGTERAAAGPRTGASTTPPPATPRMTTTAGRDARPTKRNGTAAPFSGDKPAASKGGAASRSETARQR